MCHCLPFTPTHTRTLWINNQLTDNFTYHTLCFCSIVAYTENQEKFFLYLFISVTIGVLLCLSLVIGRLIHQKRQLKLEKGSAQKSQGHNGGGSESGGGTNGFSDDISEIDGDIDMTTTTVPVPSVSRNEVSHFNEITRDHFLSISKCSG